MIEYIIIIMLHCYSILFISIHLLIISLFKYLLNLNILNSMELLYAIFDKFIGISALLMKNCLKLLYGSPLQ